VNRTYADMAEHYGTAIVPARPRKPRDKAKVEVAVQIAQRWIAARLRNQRFFSLTDLNAAIRVLVDRLNDRVTRHFGASRRDLFEQIERSALRPLPAEPYVFSEWKQCTVGLDYHVEVAKHYYSAPHSPARARRSGSGSRRGRSRSSTTANVSPPMPGPRPTASTPPSPITCRPVIDAIPNGRRNG